MEMGGEGTADEAFLHPRRVLGQLAVRRQTGQLGAGAGAARGTVVSLARAEHEIAGVAPHGWRADQFYVVHLRETLRIDGLADAPGIISQPFDVGRRQILAMIFHQKKPIAAPGNFAGDPADAGHLDTTRFDLRQLGTLATETSPLG